jgi:hypothetical protein
MRTISDELGSWLQSPEMQKASTHVLKHVKRGLKDLLGNLGFPTTIGVSAMKPSEFDAFLRQLSLKQFFEAVKEQLSLNQSTESQTPDKLTKKIWLDGALKIYDQVVRNKNAETIKNPRSAIKRFCEYIIDLPDWRYLYSDEVPEVCLVSSRAKLPCVYPGRKTEKYGLPYYEWTQKLNDELETLKEFWTKGGESAWNQLYNERYIKGGSVGSRPKVTKISLATFESQMNHVCLFFGWAIKYEGLLLENLSFSFLTDLLLLRKFKTWQIDRGRSHAVAYSVASVGIAVAKYKNFAQTQRRNWSDIDIVLRLRDLRAEFEEKYKDEKKEARKQKRSSRNITHRQLEEILPYLLEQCAAYTGYVTKTGSIRKRGKRSQYSVVQARLVYTLVSILVYLPVRQQEIRRLEEGLTLLFWLDEAREGVYTIHSIDHKLKIHTGEAHTCHLPRNLTPIIDEWLQVYRPIATSAVESLDNWLAFFGHEPGKLQQLQAKLESAQQGNIPERIKDIQKYILNLKSGIDSIQRRIDAFPIARANVAKHNSLFFCLGKNCSENFGEPLATQNLYSLVTIAIATATQEKLGKVYRVTPHVFRYVAAIHIQRIKGDRNRVSKVMNHSLLMFDQYSEVLRDPIKDATDADGWWIQS